MPSLSQMVDDVQAYLRSFTRDQELSTHLTAAATGSGLQLDVADASLVSRGRIEIEDELLWVESVDRANNTVKIAPYGRGMDGTTATTHALNSRIIMQPLYPRKMVMDTINQIIGGLGNQLYGVASATINADPQSVVYEVPSATERVLNVMANHDSTYGDAEYVRRWKFDPSSSTSSTGKALFVYEPTATGMTMTVTYFRKPELLAEGDDFGDSLLPDTAYDVVVLGAAARLMATAGAFMTSTRAVDANALDSKSDSSQVIQQSRYLFTLFQQRLEEEKTQLLNSYVTRAHYTG